MSEPESTPKPEPSTALIAAKTRARELDLEQRRADVAILSDPALPSTLRLAILGPMLWQTAVNLARGAFGKRFEGNVESVHGVMLWADGVGVDPVAALQRCYLVHGQVGCEAKLKIAVAAASKVLGPITWEITGKHGGCRESGRDRVRGGTLMVTAIATRADNGTQETETLTLQDAVDNRWTSRGATGDIPSKYEAPSMARRMLTWRTASWLIDRVDPGCVLGMPTSDELSDAATSKGLDPEEPRMVDAAVVPTAATSADELNADLETEAKAETVPLTGEAAGATGDVAPAIEITGRANEEGGPTIDLDLTVRSQPEPGLRASYVPDLAFVPCPKCGGLGVVKQSGNSLGLGVVCERCGGSGEVAVAAEDLEGRAQADPDGGERQFTKAIEDGTSRGLRAAVQAVEFQEPEEAPQEPAGEPAAPEPTADTPAPAVSPTGRKPRRAIPLQVDRIRRWTPAIQTTKGTALGIIAQEMTGTRAAAGCPPPSEHEQGTTWGKWLDALTHPETGIRQSQATRVLNRFEKQGVPLPDAVLVVEGGWSGEAPPEITDPPRDQEAPAREPAPASMPAPFPDSEPAPKATDAQVASIRHAVEGGFIEPDKVKAFLFNRDFAKVQELSEEQASELIAVVRAEIIAAKQS